uniref:Reverse transcriptase domain-containing protein n=1 Tax=Tanacetum cinerariifolium TaxID=118510 RepID=A0A6L2NVA0_TANCI|nr:hypothetical protein [Tanacetum cinerariifolium]
MLKTFNERAVKRDTNHIRTLEDYSKPSREGYRNTIELPKGNNVINFLLKGSRPTPRPSSTHNPHAYANTIYSNPHPRKQNEPPKKKSFTFRERTGPNPQPQALGTSFEARVRDYMAAHTKRIERFENAIFKQREEINDRMAEMFGLLKELTTSMAPEKVLIREEAKYQAKREEAVEAPNSRHVGYYLKHGIKEKLIDGLVDNHRFNDSLSWVRAGKMKGKTYNLLPMGPVYEAILKKKITRKEDIGGNFKIPCNIGGIAEDVLVDVVGYVHPVDFVILDIREDKKRPFILGTPFLTTAKAVIKFDKGTITLRSGKSKISFHRIPKSLGKIEKGMKNDIEPIAPTMNVNRLVLGWEERIKLHQEKEMEFDQ